MNTHIDERAAWNLVLAVPPGLAGKSSHYVYHESLPEVGLHVQASGQWALVTPPSGTPGSSGSSRPAGPEGPSDATLPTDAARDVLDLFLPLQVRTEFVIGQLGQSLDGRIATESGHSHFITGQADIRRLHRLRALVDAVLVGAGTIASDDPSLTVREVEGEHPVRVVLDPEGRLDPHCHVFADGLARTIVIRRADSGSAMSDGCELLTLPTPEAGRFDVGAVLRALRERGYTRVLVEGGGLTVSRFLQAGLLDRLHISVAPMLIGSGRSAITLDPIDSLGLAIRPACRHFHLGDDLLFDLNLRGSPGPRELSRP